MLARNLKSLMTKESSASPLTLTQSSPIFESGLNTTTHSAVNAGPESEGRILIAAIRVSGGARCYISAVTIGGVSATRRAGRTSRDYVQTDLWSAVVPTGTSVSVTVTRNTGTNGASVYLYSAEGYENADWVGATDSQASNTSTALMDVTLNIPSGGSAIAFYTGANIQSTASRVWTGLPFDADYTADDSTGTSVLGDIVLTSLASDTNLTGGNTLISFNTDDTVRRRPSFAAVSFT